jgi:hypothetical protein
MSETVKLHITIDIQQEDDDADTGLTLEQWNSLTDQERSNIYQDMWNAMAEQDNGGVSVVTPGAKEV